MRETLRKHISEAAYLDAGVERIVDQVVNPKIYSVFTPQIEDVVYKYLGLEKPKREKNGGHSIKDLLPIDLDPVSPESDKNSLKDVSLDSVDDLPITSKQDSDLVDHKNDDSSQVGDRDKSFEEKDTVDSREVVENEANGNESVQSTAEEEKIRAGCSTPQLADPGLNDSIKSDDKTEEEEEDSPVFEPIDIMNFNESLVSNDSHLSGISELTSHRSRSPDFQINEFSRDHFDFSNQDSQFSKVSSDSRLSIVTDFGSSNQASTPVPDIPKEEKSKDKSDDDKNKDKDKERSNESKDSKNAKGNSSKERGRDKSDYKSKSSKERSDSRDSRSHRDRDYKKKSTDSKSDRDRSKSSRDSSDKSRDKDKDGKDKVKDEKTSSAGKDLKDIYKEKIRELREKKELTEKEKLNKDKDSHKSRDSKDKKDSKDYNEKDSKDRRDSKEHRSSSSSSRSHRHDSRSKRDDSKSSRDKKRDDRHSRDKSRSQGDSDGKRSSKDDKSDKDKDYKSTQKRKESRPDESRKNSDKSYTDKNKDKDKDKKRRDEKKSKSKDDHSSLRKSSNDRRSSDRDGSSGSNGKGSKNSCPGSSASSSKANSGLKETGNVSNSSSETSDGVDESQVEEYHNTDGESAIQVDQETEVSGVNAKRVDLGLSEISLPLKKRPLPADADDSVESSPKKMKFPNNFKEDDKVIKMKKQFEHSDSDVNCEQDIKVPDDERVQIIEVREPQDDDEDEPYPDDKDVNSKLGQSDVIMEGDNFFKINVIDSCKSNLTEMEMSIRESLNEMMADKIIGRDGNDNKQDITEDKLENNLILNESNDLSGEVKTRVESDDEDCLYFVEDNERLNKFKLFLKSLDIDIARDIDDEDAKDLSSDDTEVKQLLLDDENEESAATVTMAPPQLKRKYSTSPLSDIVLNSDNNNDGHKVTGVGDTEDKKKSREKDTGLGKKKLGRPKRQRPSVSSSSPNDDFMMPLSPESDVSATSDKASANHKDKDDKRYFF